MRNVLKWATEFAILWFVKKSNVLQTCTEHIICIVTVNYVSINWIELNWIDISAYVLKDASDVRPWSINTFT